MTMKRSFFIAFAAAALSVIAAPLAKAEELAKSLQANPKSLGWTKPTCGSAVVWLDIPSGIYYRKGARWYGRTKRGAYTCENLAISAGNRASLS
jgi:hypothetical protein